MTRFECETCKRTFNTELYYKSHINGKVPCTPPDDVKELCENNLIFSVCICGYESHNESQHLNHTKECQQYFDTYYKPPNFFSILKNKVTIRSFPEISPITYEDVIKVLSIENTFNELIEVFHLDENKPENHNMYFVDKPNTQVKQQGKIYQNGYWHDMDVDKMLSITVKERMKDLKKYLKANPRIEAKEFMALYDSDFWPCEQNMRVVGIDIRKLLYENREILIKSRVNSQIIEQTQRCLSLQHTIKELIKNPSLIVDLDLQTAQVKQEDKLKKKEKN